MTTPKSSRPRVAIVHDWLVRSGGAERVLERLLELWPGADLFTLFWVPGSVSQRIESRLKGTSFIQRFPGLKRHYGSYLPLFPKAVESLPLSGYDLVISSSYCVAKGALANTTARHLCYCHTPMRYVWHQQGFYERDLGRLGRSVYRAAAARLRVWDLATAQRPDKIVANSRSVAGRIKALYGREAEVLHPPVETGFFTPGAPRGGSGYYLTVGALVPYKSTETAVEAFNRMGRRLLVAGAGQEMAGLRRLAGPTVEFLGWQSHDAMLDLYRGCRALISPGEEDFGIAMVEAQACGRPVIALDRGGACEIVEDGVTGLLVKGIGAGALVEAVNLFERKRFFPRIIRENAVRFSASEFAGKIKKTAANLIDGAL